MTDRRPALHATDKLAFLLSLVPWLIDHERVSVAEAAAHFGVGVTDIRRAVELIAVDVAAVAGSPLNLKVTFPEDVALAAELAPGLSPGGS